LQLLIIVIVITGIITIITMPAVAAAAAAAVVTIINFDFTIASHKNYKLLLSCCRIKNLCCVSLFFNRLAKKILCGKNKRSNVKIMLNFEITFILTSQ
jgi:hypothetical protein